LADQDRPTAELSNRAAAKGLGHTLAAILAVSALYTFALGLATYPAVERFGSELAVADFMDPLQHLWLLRWYRSCLLEARFPLFCPEIQWPLGAPIGLFSPLQAQAVLYLLGSLATTNDVLLYNSILYVELMLTGLGSFALARFLTGGFWGPTLAGLAAMLSGPMLLNVQAGGTELMALGAFALFLIGWIRFVDRPSGGRLAAAWGLYLFLCACASYYGLMGTIPAALYVFIQAFQNGRRGVWVWTRPRLVWFGAFSALALLTIPALFAAPIWAMGRGHSLERSSAQFARFGTTLGHYVLPWQTHRLYRALPESCRAWPLYRQATSVYLGVVPLALLGYAAGVRLRFRKAGFLWLAFGALVILSLGASVTLGNRQVSMPAQWLRDGVPPFRALRVPVRYGYLGVVCAAVIAGAAAEHLLKRLPCSVPRAAAGLTLAALIVADLGLEPFHTRALPEPPAAYEALRRAEPKAAFLEVHEPTFHLSYEAAIAYWQARLGGRTSAGYSGVENLALERRAGLASPFRFDRLADPAYPAAEGPERFGLTGAADFEDYLWLYLNIHDYDYVMLHRWTIAGDGPPPALEAIRKRLRHAIRLEDERVAVIDRRLLRPPSHPVAVPVSGWGDRLHWRDRTLRTARQSAELAVYCPPEASPRRFEVEAGAHREPRTVRLLLDGFERGRWTVEPGPPRRWISEPLPIEPGLHRVRLESDAEAPARAALAKAIDRPLEPFSFFAAAVRLRPETEPERERRERPPLTEANPERLARSPKDARANARH